MLPLCEAEGIGVLPWSPLARGRLARPAGETTRRQDTDQIGKTLYTSDDADRRVINRVGEIAAARGVPRAQVALAWMLHKPAVTAPIIGVSRPGHLEDVMAALDLTLDAGEMVRLEESYVPHAVAGHT